MKKLIVFLSGNTIALMIIMAVVTLVPDTRKQALIALGLIALLNIWNLFLSIFRADRPLMIGSAGLLLLTTGLFGEVTFIGSDQASFRGDLWLQMGICSPIAFGIVIVLGTLVFILFSRKKD